MSSAPAADGLQDLLLPQTSRVAPRLVARLTTRLSPRLRLRMLVRLPRGRSLYQAGNYDDAVYVIQSGVIGLEHFAASGRRSIIDVLSTGDFFGEESFVDAQGSYAPTAMADSMIYRFGLDMFSDLLAEIGMTEDWQAVLVLKCLRRQALLLQYSTTDCECRLAMRLQSLAAMLGERRGDSLRIPLRIRHEDFAAMIGTTRSRVGLFLQRFEDSGIITRPGALINVREHQLDAYIAQRTGLPGPDGSPQYLIAGMAGPTSPG